MSWAFMQWGRGAATFLPRRTGKYYQPGIIPQREQIGPTVATVESWVTFDESIQLKTPQYQAVV